MYSKDFRLLAIKLLNRFSNYRKVCSLLHISLSTLHKWKHNGIGFKQRTKRKLTQLVIDTVDKVVQDNPFVTVKDVVLALMNKGIKRCNKTVYAYLKKANITKKKAYHYCPQHFHVEKEQTFKEKMLQDANCRFISVDECYFSEKVLPHYGYSKKGVRINTDLLPKKWQKRSLLFAVSSDGYYYYEIVYGSVNKDIFNTFVDSLNLLDRDRMMLDNVAFHHSNVLPNFIYTPPYQPQYNPVEYCFSKIKNAFRRSCSFTIDDNIIKSIETLTQDDIMSCFKHVFKLIKE